MAAPTRSLTAWLREAQTTNEIPLKALKRFAPGAASAPDRSG
jgi:hypothetical protein